MIPRVAVVKTQGAVIGMGGWERVRLMAEHAGQSLVESALALPVIAPDSPEFARASVGDAWFPGDVNVERRSVRTQTTDTSEGERDDHA